jgi:hypothetical protein
LLPLPNQLFIECMCRNSLGENKRMEDSYQFTTGLSEPVLPGAVGILILPNFSDHQSQCTPAVQAFTLKGSCRVPSGDFIIHCSGFTGPERWSLSKSSPRPYSFHTAYYRQQPTNQVMECSFAPQYETVLIEGWSDDSCVSFR